MRNTFLILSCFLLISCNKENNSQESKAAEQVNTEEIITEEKAPSASDSTLEKDISSSPEENTEEVKNELVTNDVKTEVPTEEKVAKKKPIEKVQDRTFIYKAFDLLLKKHVTANGNVNYKGLNAEKKQLQAYLNTLNENAPAATWPKNDKLAYYINLYNASTIKLILDHYPLKSIMDIDGGKAWDRKFVKSGGKIYSLNNIENDIIRPRFNDARIHFAVNCAAQSCPKLLNEAYDPEKLSRQLNNSAKYFINNTSKNTIEADKVAISKIFEWYADDFKSYKGVIGFIQEYSSDNVSGTAKISYLEYDWSLNE